MIVKAKRDRDGGEQLKTLGILVAQVLGDGVAVTKQRATPDSLIGETVQELKPRRQLLIGQVRVQGQGDGGVGEVVRIGFGFHLKRDAKICLPQKTDAARDLHAGLGCVRKPFDDRDADALGLLQPVPQHAIRGQYLLHRDAGYAVGAQITAPGLKPCVGRIGYACARHIRA